MAWSTREYGMSIWGGTKILRNAGVPLPPPTHSAHDAHYQHITKNDEDTMTTL